MSGTLTTLLQSLDDDPQRRGKQFEKIVAWWLQNDPTRRRNVRRVWLWDDWPNRSGPDIGVDLVAEFADQSLCAIQAKCFDQQRDIPKSEIDSFISAATPAIFRHKMLVATTDGASHNARRALNDNGVNFVSRSDLESFLQWPATFSELAAPAWTLPLPRPHQEEAIEAVLQGLKHQNRGHIVMACGTGKTLTAMWIMERLSSHLTYVFVPSLTLLAQTLREWTRCSTTNWEYLCICSDETVDGDADNPQMLSSELDTSVTTDPTEVSSFLARSSRRIVFCTYQSAHLLAGRTVSCNLAVFDEAHQLTGPETEGRIQLLDGESILCEKRLFMTATPRIFGDSAIEKAERNGGALISMDNTSIFGACMHRLSFREAIARGLLTDFHVAVVCLSGERIENLVSSGRILSIKRERAGRDPLITDSKTLAAHVGLLKAIKKFNIRSIITFHSRVEKARTFSRDLPDIARVVGAQERPAQPIWSDYVSGSMPVTTRNSLLKELVADPERVAVIANAQCLREGVDVPALDAVAFIDPRHSQIDIIQAVGRTLRKSPGKGVGIVILPVLIPDLAEVDAIADSDFRSIWDILNALSSHDEDFSIELSALRLGIESTRAQDFGHRKLTIDVPLNITDVAPDLAKQLTLRIMRRAPLRWETFFEILQTFFQERRHTFVDVDESFRNIPLGEWVARQRRLQERGKLSAGRATQLSSFPDWTSDTKLADFQVKLNQIRHLSLLAGSTCVPNRESNIQLAKLVNDPTSQKAIFAITDFRKRYLLAKSKKPLADFEIRALEALPAWTWDTKFAEACHIADLVTELQALSGTTLIPTSLRYRGNQVGEWLARLRRTYLSEPTKVDAKVVEKFERIENWVWVGKTTMNDFYAKLLEVFVYKFGLESLMESTEVAELQVGVWAKKIANRLQKPAESTVDILQQCLGPDWLEEIKVWSSTLQDDDSGHDV